MGAFPNLSRNVPFCPRLSSFVLLGAQNGDKSGQKRTNEDKTGHFGTNWETPPFSIYPHLALLKNRAIRDSNRVIRAETGTKPDLETRTIATEIATAPFGQHCADLNTEAEKRKAYTTTTERKSFGELFWPKRKTFQAGGGYQNPVKTRKTISTTEIFPLWPPFFSAKKSSALEQGGVCFLFPSRRAFSPEQLSEP